MIIKAQRGVTLVEVIVVMVLSVMLIMVAALGIGAFFRKYAELNAWAELQKDALDCINTIKNGVPVGNFNDLEYIGVTNAMKLQLTNTTTTSSSGLKITPPSSSSIYTSDYAHFYLYNGVVRCAYVFHGVQAASPLYIFPKQENIDKMIVDKFTITKINTREQDVLAVQVELNARVKTGDKTFRQVHFKTKMVKK
jgi:prepilin-type N-terminal cleavage/methylation domain-containing protein